jgi:hypothetical protein
MISAFAVGSVVAQVGSGVDCNQSALLRGAAVNRFPHYLY